MRQRPKRPARSSAAEPEWQCRGRRFHGAAAALGLCLSLSLATSTTSVAFGHGGGFGGGGFGGGHFGGFGGFHGGYFGGGHFGGFHGGYFGGGSHFGGFRYGGRHYGGTCFGGFRYGGRHFGARGAFGHHRFVGNFAHVNGARAFNHAGFSGFGGRGGWNKWNRGHGYYGGYGWNGWGWGGWAGPVFWPFFYGDVLSFALWPYDFYDPFFDYGPDYLFSSFFWPGPWLGDDINPYDIYGYAGDAVTPHQHTRRAAVVAQSESVASCASLAPGITGLPIDKIEKAIQPSAAQTATLDDLKSALATANDLLQASCPSQVPLTPVSRLDAVSKRLDAMIQALQILREPLTTLYDSLGDARKTRFDSIVMGKHRRKTSNAKAGSHDLGDLCTGQARGFAYFPAERIEQIVKPTDAQKGAFMALKDASAKGASGIESSCPANMPQTLSDRFDAILKRLDALAVAVKIVEPALKDFYASLTDEQKAQFNLMTPAPNPSRMTRRE
jgi:hypothetical protein